MLPCISGGRLGENDPQRQNRLCFSDYLLVPVTVVRPQARTCAPLPAKRPKKLLTIPNGTVVQCYGNKENGWARVAYNGKAGYVSLSLYRL